MTASTATQPYTVQIMPRPTPDLPHRAIVSIHYDGEPLAWAAFAGLDDATAYLNPVDTDPGSISAAAGHYLTRHATLTATGKDKTMNTADKLNILRALELEAMEGHIFDELEGDILDTSDGLGRRVDGHDYRPRRYVKIADVAKWGDDDARQVADFLRAKHYEQMDGWDYLDALRDVFESSPIQAATSDSVTSYAYPKASEVTGQVAWFASNVDM